MSKKYSTVTVVFAGEVATLAAQASSMARFADDKEIDRIYLCINDVASEKVCRGVREILHRYGKLREKVVILGDGDLFESGRRAGTPIFRLRRLLARHLWPRVWRRKGWRGNDGWFMQQACKLDACRFAKTDDIVLLDAKNIFIDRIQHSDFFDEHGRPRARFGATGPLHKKWFSDSARCVGLDPPDAPETLTHFVTPFAVSRQVCVDLIEHLAARDWPIEAVFANPLLNATEFMMIDAFIIKKYGTLDGYFSDGMMRSYSLFANMEAPLMKEILRDCQAENGKVVGLHRAAIDKLDGEGRELLAQLGVEPAPFP
jgi:hypothetical protein